MNDVIWKQMALYQNQELFPNAKSDGVNSQSKCSLTNQTMQELELFNLSPDSWSGLEQEPMKAEGHGQFVATQKQGILVLKSLQSICILIAGSAWNGNQQKPL